MRVWKEVAAALVAGLAVHVALGGEVRAGDEKRGGARPPARGWRSVETDEGGKIRLIVSYKSGQDRESIGAEVDARGKGRVRRAFRHLRSRVIEVSPEDVEQVVRDLEGDPRVDYVEPDLLDQEALAQTLPWGIDRVDAEIRHAAGSRGAGVKVAVIDTGIWYSSAAGRVHADLAPVYKGGWDFVNGDASPWDDNGHGTHVAGILAAADNAIGVVGVAPAVSLYVLKTLNSRGFGRTSDLIAALDWCIDHGIEVVNYSAGFTTDSAAVREACDAARAAGVIVVASAGNDGGAVRYPAAYDSVIAVAAVDRDDARYAAGNSGPELDLVAPGVEILSTVVGGGYSDLWTGTSMASPHVAGAAALLVAGGMTDPATVQAFLEATAQDLGASGRDDLFGHGLVTANGTLGDQPAVLAPLPGDVVPAGSPTLIDWEPLAGASHYRVLASLDGARTWQVLAAALSEDELAWSVPVPAGNRAFCTVQVAAYDGTGRLLGVTASGPFTVEVLRIDSPAENAALVSGEDVTISWTVHATIRPVAKIRLFSSGNGGKSWSLMATLGPARTSFVKRLPVTSVTLTGRLFRVTLYDRAGRIIGRKAVAYSVVPAGG